MDICINCGVNPINESYAEEELCTNCASELDSHLDSGEEEYTYIQELNFSESRQLGFRDLPLVKENEDEYYEDGDIEGRFTTGC